MTTMISTTNIGFVITLFFINDQIETSYLTKMSEMQFFLHFFLQNISAYLGKRLSGKVLATFVRGNLVYSEGEHASAACGALILAKQ